MTNEQLSVDRPNRAQRRSAARKVAAAGSAAVLASATAGAVMTFTGSVAGAAPTDVTNCDDSGYGSLRDAILYTETHAGPDTITISAVCTASSPVNVGSVMAVTEGDLTIVGPGAADFVLDGGGTTAILEVNSGSNIGISGVTFQNAYSNEDGGAVAINDFEDATISAVVFRDNRAAYDGGALYVDDGNDVTIVDTLFDGNRAEYNGGALYLLYTDGAITISNSTFADNFAGEDGGAISIYETSASFALFNSTITGNSAGSWGAAIMDHGLYGNGTMLFNTVADNTSPNDSGLYISYYAAKTWTLGGNIFSGTTAVVFLEDVNQAITTYNNDFHGGVTGFTPDATDLDVDPQLEELADNGGPTPTRALAATSPVVDQGPASWTTFAGDGFDQRGTPYVRVYGGRSDMGAYEAQPGGPTPGPEPTPEPTFTG